MPDQTQTGLKLPQKLLDQLVLDRREKAGRSKIKGFQSRKDRRKAARVEKKVRVQRPKPSTQVKRPPRESHTLSAPRTTKQKPRAAEPTREGNLAIEAPTSITKHAAREQKSKVRGIKEEKTASEKPAKTKNARLAQDDAEIEALEKALGIKRGMSLPKSFGNDGLGDLLDGIEDSEGDIDERSREEEAQWLRQKRRKTNAATENSDTDHSLSNDSEDFHKEQSDEERDPTQGEDEGNSDGGSFGGFEDEEHMPYKPPRENPYIAPVPAAVDRSSSSKYVPPSLRGVSTAEEESLKRLQKQARGLLNRISEANLISIVSEFETIYRENPRQHVSATMLDLLMGVVCDSSSLQDTFVVLHAGFVAAIHKIIGVDFSAQAVKRIVEEYDKVSIATQENNDFHGKRLSNIVTLLAELYNFQVVGCGLIHDFIRGFVANISERNTELLLRVIKHCGHQIRQDDPSSLKEIVLQLQSSMDKIGRANLSVRTEFMAETINNLKNNRTKIGANAEGVLSEHIVKMKKLLGSLNTRNLKATEPLQVPLADIRDSEGRGKWWLVGASYKDKHDDADRDVLKSVTLTDPSESASDQPVDLLSMAKEQRMNTDIRRSIFVTIMSASDFKDAELRLMKLKLKRSQEPEIAKVLIHCASGEDKYNPYYTLIAGQLCATRRFKMLFQFALWDQFKRMEDKTEDSVDDNDDGHGMGMRAIVNLAKMYGSLVANIGLGLSILKNLDFAYLPPKIGTFVEIFMMTVLVESHCNLDVIRCEEFLIEQVTFLNEMPELLQGLLFFVRKVLRKTDLAGSKQDKATVRWGCRILQEAIENTGSKSI